MENEKRREPYSGRFNSEKDSGRVAANRPARPAGGSPSRRQALRRPSGFGTVAEPSGRPRAQAADASARRNAPRVGARSSSSAGTDASKRAYASGSMGTDASKRPYASGSTGMDAAAKAKAAERIREEKEARRRERNASAEGARGLLKPALIGLAAVLVVVLVITLIFGKRGTVHQLPRVERESSASFAATTPEAANGAYPTSAPESTNGAYAAISPESTASGMYPASSPEATADNMYPATSPEAANSMYPATSPESTANGADFAPEASAEAGVGAP